MCDDIGTGKKIAVGMLEMFVSSKSISTDLLLIPANAPMAIFFTLDPLTPKCFNRGEYAGNK